MQDTNTLTIEKIGTIVFPGAIPSVNEFNKKANHNHFDGGKFEKKWKEIAYTKALEWLNERWPRPYPLSDGVSVIIRVFRPNNIRRDVHNLFIKPIFDGFTEAKLWADDNEKIVPKVTFEYCGVDRENPRVEFEIYQEVQIG